MDERRITLCLTTFNRFECTLESFVQVADDDRISEIIIVDDCSEMSVYKKLETAVSFCPKVKLFRNAINYDCYLNKQHAISFANNDWVIILDSDNVIDKSYLDRIYEVSDWDNKTSYMPSFAMPLFKYTHFSGMTFSKENVSNYLEEKLFDTMLNCFNFFINKNEYLNVFDSSIDPVTADSIYFNYCWFAAGNKMYVVPELHYQHTISKDSHYQLNNKRTGNIYSEVIEKLKNLK